MDSGVAASTSSSSSPACWKLKKAEDAAAGPLLPNPTLVEVHEWVQPSHCHQHDSTLRPGHLLRWMDITACLSAEKHAMFPCVTVSVDDITFESRVSVGHVVILTAVVNRSFSSSLEVGIEVQSENPMTGEKVDLCNARCVFVAKPKNGSKAKLPPIPLVTEKEHREHLLAAERRNMRISYRKDLNRVLKELNVTEKKDSVLETKGEMYVSHTKIHTVQIVLPIHANHHGTTFGGQIMEWMTDIATISALRLSRSAIVLEGIESVHFMGPSYMGERVFIQSTVNKVFSNKRFEVGVRVEGYAVGGEERHINSAFFIFRATEEGLVLPKLVPDGQDEEMRAANAVARHCLWLDRKAIQIQEHLVILNSENVYSLIVKNISKVMTIFSLRNWEVLPSSAEVEYYKKEVNENIFLKLVQEVEGINAVDTYSKLINYTARKQWDFLCKNVRLVKNFTNDNSLLHMAYIPLRPDELPKDFVLLASKRTPSDHMTTTSGKQYYMIAYSSVLVPDLVPPLKDYNRSQVISSGYIIEDVTRLQSEDGIDSEGNFKRCRVTYLHQLGSTVMPFFSKDLLGVSSLMEKIALRMKKYILAS